MTPAHSLRALCAAGWLALAGCSAAAPQAAAVPAEPAGAEAQLQALIGNATCSDDSQCRTLGWGAKACGGPQRWVAWSTQSSDGAALEALAKAHAEQERKEQQRLGMASNCAYVADPGARCVAQRCVLREREGVALPQ